MPVVTHAGTMERQGKTGSHSQVDHVSRPSILPIVPCSDMHGKDTEYPRTCRNFSVLKVLVWMDVPCSEEREANTEDDQAKVDCRGLEIRGHLYHVKQGCGLCAYANARPPRQSNVEEEHDHDVAFSHSVAHKTLRTGACQAFTSTRYRHFRCPWSFAFS